MAIDAALEAHYTTRHDEAHRLSSTLKGRLELARVQELLGRYLPDPPAVVADVGGGPGVHARWLQELGYAVELLDPVQRHVEQARAAGIDARLGDARWLPWEDASFDAVLLAGPMYHLTAAADRRLALHEASRVTRPGGFVAVVAINRAANLIGSLLANRLQQRERIVREILETGYSADNERMAETTYHSVTQLRTELTSVGFRAVTVHGLTGPGGWLTVTLDAHFGRQPAPESMTDPDPLETALICSRLADRCPELVPSSSLFFAVGQRV
ncbi:Methyltransferase type 11 [Kribbella flavida DSM 17836]|uniref:Methyltransferase type 11 n=1 Tax=Kribbella flavida (strain DSM 17836 / JCM 10339 / NBRC 14399) TaxID=479435 RepID=D2Q293_KRIFD|nr:class I SAM-dependent methyltransferase [Kribbella flavida]ADB35789.1 Methyltransferase type 11 [Kribbella flavida DSM 17836]